MGRVISPAHANIWRADNPRKLPRNQYTTEPVIMPEKLKKLYAARILPRSCVGLSNCRMEMSGMS